MTAKTVLAVAASSGKIGFVFFRGPELADWGLSAKASQSTDEAFEKVSRWLRMYKPELLLTEHLDDGSRARGS